VDDLFHRVARPARFFDRYPPFRVAGVVATGTQVAANLDQVIRNTLIIEQGCNVVSREPLRVSRQVNVKICAILADRGDFTVCMQMLAAGRRYRCVYRRGRWRFIPGFVRAEAPEIDEWSYGDIEGAIGQIAKFNCFLNCDTSELLR